VLFRSPQNPKTPNISKIGLIKNNIIFPKNYKLKIKRLKESFLSKITTNQEY